MFSFLRRGSLSLLAPVLFTVLLCLDVEPAWAQQQVDGFPSSVIHEVRSVVDDDAGKLTQLDCVSDLIETQNYGFNGSVFNPHEEPVENVSVFWTATAPQLDQLEGELTLEQGTIDASDANNNVTFNIGTLQPGQEVAYHIEWLAVEEGAATVTKVFEGEEDACTIEVHELATVQVFKYEDLNANGAPDSEPLLGGWVIELSGTTVIDTEFGATRTTSSGGAAEFNEIPPGDYTVTETVQPGWTQSDPGGGTSIALALGSDQNAELSFGNYQPGGIAGTKWNDLDGDGQRDGGEPGLEGWTIQIDGADAATTDSDGNYLIADLEPGTYEVSEVVQNGWTQTSPAGGTHTVTVESGQIVEGVDFGNTQPQVGAGLGGTKFEDLNANGARDPGEPGLQGWTIKLDDGSSVVTDAQGNYVFSDLDPGTYTVSEVLQDGWTQSFPELGTHTVTLTEGEFRGGLDFGNYEPAGLGGTVWNDVNQDGTQNPGEQGLPNWTVLLDGTPTAVTDGDGQYVIMDLEPGTYTVSLDVQGGWAQTYPPGGSHTVTLESGDFDGDVDFGVVGGTGGGGGDDDDDDDEKGRICGLKYEDLNGDGKQGSSDTGVPGWPINLDGTDEDGNQVSLSTTTDGAGAYCFTVDPGLYFVSEGVRNNWKASTATTSDALLVDEGTSIEGIDFGNFEYGSDQGIKYEDLNGNGRHDAGERTLQGWTITLRGQTSKGEEVDRLMTTDQQGRYLFDKIEPGRYTLDEVLQPGWKRSSRVFTSSLQKSGEHVRTSIGNYRPAKVQGVVFEDLLADGTQDADDPGLEGVQVELMGTNGKGRNVNRTVTTDGSGQYVIDDLAPGSYTVTLTLTDPTMRRSMPTDGKYSFTVVSGEVVDERDFGAYCLRNLVVVVWQDNDGDGVDGGEEPPMPGRMVTVEGPIGTGASEEEDGTTDGDGVVTFTDMIPGEYVIRSPLPDGWKNQSTPNGGQHEIELESDCRDLLGDDAYRFGNVPKGTFSLTPQVLLMNVGDTQTLTIKRQNEADEDLNIQLTPSASGIVSLDPSAVTIGQSEQEETVQVAAQAAGDVKITLQGPPGWVSASGPAEVRVGPDLLASSLSVTPTTNARQLEYEIQVTIANAPDRVDAGPFQVLIQEQDRRKSGGTTTIHRESFSSGMASGSHQTLLIPYLPTTTRPTILVKVDHPDAISEPDEGNNNVSKKVEIDFKPEKVYGETDGIDDPEVIGRYLSFNAPLIENTFVATVDDAEVEVEKVVFELGGRTKEATEQEGLYKVDFATNTLAAKDHTLKVYAIGPRGVESDPVTKTVRVEELPDWLRGNVTFFGALEIELTEKRYVVTTSIPAGSSGEGVPFFYDVKFHKEIYGLGDKSLSTESSVNISIGLPLKPTVGGSFGLSFTQEQSLGLSTIPSEEFGFTIGLKPDFSFDSFVWNAVDKTKRLFGAEVQTRPFLGTPFSWLVVGIGLDVYGNLQAVVVVEEDDGSAKFGREEGEVSRLVPGLGLQLTGVLAADAALASLALFVAPRVDIGLGVEYTTDNGFDVHTAGEFQTTFGLVGEVAGFEGTIASITFGPYPMFGDGNKRGEILLPIPEQVLPAVPATLPLPSMASASDGTVLVTWLESVEGATGSRLFYATKGADEGNFSESSVIHNTDAHKSDPALAFHPDGAARLVWTQNSRSADLPNTDPSLSDVLRYQDIYYATWDGTAWGAPQPVTNGGQEDALGDGQATVIVAPDGSEELILWTRSTSATDALDFSEMEVFYAPVSEGATGTPAPLTDNATVDYAVAATYYADREAVAVWLGDGDGDPATVSDTEVRYSVWSGGGWSAATPLVQNGNWFRDVDVGVLKDGRPLAAWVEVESKEDETLQYVLKVSLYDPSTDTWSPPEDIIRSEHLIESPIVQVDQRNIASLTWRGYRGHVNGDMLIALKDYRSENGNWTSPRPLTDDNLADWLATAVTDASGNHYVVNFKTETEDASPASKAYKPNFYGGLNLIQRGIRSDLQLTGDLNLGSYDIDPDLRIDSTSFRLLDPDAVVGDEVTYEVAITNHGGVASEATTLRVYDGHPAAGAEPIGSDIAIEDLVPDSSTTVQFQWTLPEEGMLFLHVDPDEEITEQDEQNNVLEVDASPLPDLTVGRMALQFEGVPAIGEDGTATVYVKNEGQAPSTLTTMQFVGLAESAGADTLLAEEVAVDSVTPEDSLALTVPVPVRRAGRYQLTARVNHEGLIEERSSTNNEASTPLAVLPDLQIDSLWTGEETAHALVRNAGGAPSPDFKAVFFEGDPLGDGIRRDSVTVSAMRVRQRDTLTFAYVPPPGLTSVAVWLDPAETVDELTLLNNSGEVGVATSGVPDLVAALMPVSGGREVEVRIGNGGTGTSAAFSYDLSIRSEDQGVDSILVVRGVEWLDPRETHVDTIAVELGSEAEHLHLRVDPTDQIQELIETNNAVALGADAGVAVESGTGVPDQFYLAQNYPNPFNPRTTIAYGLREAAHVRLEVYNVLGQRVATLVDREQSVGTYRVEWIPKSLASGVYLLRLQAAKQSGGVFSETKKTVFVK